MHFDYSTDQHDIKRTAHDLLTARATLEKVREAAEARKPDDALFRELSELGWLGIAVPEENGGQGLGTLELAILAEELGYALAPAPFLGTVAAAAVITEAGSEEQKDRWLPKLAAGEATGALGIAKDGVAELVPDGPGAAVLVLVEDGAARLVEPGDAEIETIESIDPTRAYARVRAAGGDPLPGDPAPGVDRATIAVAAELVGVAQRMLEMTVAYVKERKQFDTPVGAFQAVSHRCAQMLLDTEGARSATLFAAWAADAEPARLAEGASLAKAAASAAGRDVTASAIQAHGGIGFTWEADVHWFYKRAQLGAQYLGGAAQHRARAVRLRAQSGVAA